MWRHRAQGRLHCLGGRLAVVHQHKVHNRLPHVKQIVLSSLVHQIFDQLISIFLHQRNRYLLIMNETSAINTVNRVQISINIYPQRIGQSADDVIYPTIFERGDALGVNAIVDVVVIFLKYKLYVIYCILVKWVNV